MTIDPYNLAHMTATCFVFIIWTITAIVAGGEMVEDKKPVAALIVIGSLFITTIAMLVFMCALVYENI